MAKDPICFVNKASAKAGAFYFWKKKGFAKEYQFF